MKECSARILCPATMHKTSMPLEVVLTKDQVRAFCPVLLASSHGISHRIEHPASCLQVEGVEGPGRFFFDSVEKAFQCSLTWRDARDGRDGRDGAHKVLTVSGLSESAEARALERVMQIANRPVNGRRRDGDGVDSAGAAALRSLGVCTEVVVSEEALAFMGPFPASYEEKCP